MNWLHVCTCFDLLSLPETSTATSNSGIWTCNGVLSCADYSASAAVQHYAVKTLENLYTIEKRWPETLAHPSAAGRQLCISMSSIASLKLSQSLISAPRVLSC